MGNKILVALGALAVILSMSVFTVGETERVIKFQLGEIVGADFQPGMHLKIPFINNVKKFDARILTMDATPERFLTAEKKNVIVDSFVKWRIGDVKTFYTTVGGDVGQANIRLDQIIKDAARSEFSKREIRQLVSTDRSAIRDSLITNVSPHASRLGINIVDVQVKRIDLPNEVSTRYTSGWKPSGRGWHASFVPKVPKPRSGFVPMPINSAKSFWPTLTAIPKYCAARAMLELRIFSLKLTAKTATSLPFTAV